MPSTLGFQRLLNPGYCRDLALVLIVAKQSFGAQEEWPRPSTPRIGSDVASGRIISPGKFRLPPARCILILDDVVASVASQLDQQAALGVDIESEDAVPDHGPVHGGVWVQIPEVTVVFTLTSRAPLPSTISLGPRLAIRAYTFFNRAMVAVLKRLSSQVHRRSGRRRIWPVQRKGFAVSGGSRRDHHENAGRDRGCGPVPAV